MHDIVKMIILVSTGLIRQVGSNHCCFVCVGFCNGGDTGGPSNYFSANHLGVNLDLFGLKCKIA